MARLECELRGDFWEVLSNLEDAVLTGNVSASKEGDSVFHVGDTLCAVRVYERYSFFGDNRVSLNITLLEAEGAIISIGDHSGREPAIFWKINTIGEEAFLGKIQQVVARYHS